MADTAASAASRGLPVVVLVGRPNVGKSTLFNRLIGARRAIVDDAPGVTRDRLVAPASHAGRTFLCVDTGGFLAETPQDRGTLVAQVRAQTLAAIEQADCVVCVFDGQSGLGPPDREMVDVLRRSGKPTLFVAQKIDTPRHEPLVSEFYAAGADHVIAVSAEHSRGLTALRDAVVAALPPGSGVTAETAGGTRLALVGRPNVGKSSLLNRLLGTERAIVAPEPGTTRDAIDTPLTVGGRSYVLIDTAGIRRRARVTEPLERHGAVRALGTLVRTDLVLVVLDAQEGMTDQDAHLVGRAWDAGRGIILVANKWDLLPRERRDRRTFQAALAAAHAAFADLPLLPVSAKTGEGLSGVFPLVAQVERAYGATLATPALNRALAAAVAAHAPPSPGGRPLRFLYATQTGRRPPAISIFGSAPGSVPRAYARYLASQLSATFRLVGVPLRLDFRARRPEGQRARPRGVRRRR